ncbi:hypothetical protein M0804_009763 [Polistes exclamans]|nr:hypothetical protein M0804_009763 [Polistes exclamans]
MSASACCTHRTRAAANGSASCSVSLDIGHVVFTLWKVVAGGLIYVQAIRSSCATLYHGSSQCVVKEFSFAIKIKTQTSCQAGLTGLCHGGNAEEKSYGVRDICPATRGRITNEFRHGIPGRPPSHTTKPKPTEFSLLLDVFTSRNLQPSNMYILDIAMFTDNSNTVYPTCANTCCKYSTFNTIRARYPMPRLTEDS